MKAKNKLFFIGLIAYLILLILAVVFYQERSLWGDLAFHLFYIVKDGNFAIQNGRFGAFMTQIVPLLATKAGLSLSSIALSYSLSFVFYYLLFFLLAFKVFDNPKAGICMLLLSTLMVTDTFYWIQSELPQGLALLMVFFALITKHIALKDYRKIDLFLLPFILITIVYFHPLIFIPFLFICLFIYFSAAPIANKKLLLGAFVFCLVMLFLKQTILKLPSAYEDKALERLSNFYTLFPDFFTLDYNIIFLKLVLKKFYFLILLLALVTAWYVQQKNYFKLSLTWGFFLGYLILINVVQTSMPFLPFYLENLYLPLSLFVILPFVVDYLPSRTAGQQVLLVGGIVLVGLIRIAYHSGIYTERLNWEKELIAKTATLTHQKLIVPQAQIPNRILMETAWASPYEFWLLSSIQHPEKPRSIIVHPDPKALNYSNKKKQLLTFWGGVKYKKLNESPYFNFQDSSSYVLYKAD